MEKHEKAQKMVEAGNLLYQVGQKPLADSLYQFALDEGYEPAKFHIAVSLINERKSMDRAFELLYDVKDPENPLWNYLMGTVYRFKLDPLTALPYHLKSLELSPESPEFLEGTAHCCHMLGDHRKALKYHTTASDLDMDNPSKKMYVGMDQMLLGDWENGLINYKQRERGLIYLPSKMKRWDGKSDNILITAEQGAGDLIMMLRFAGKLKAIGCYVAVLCPKYLHDIVKCVDGVDKVVETEAEVSHLDLTYIPAFNLMGTFCKEDWPSDTYIHIPEGISSMMSRFKETVGLCWKGNPAHLNDFMRSVSLPTLARMVDYQISSLQYNPGLELLQIERFPANTLNAESSVMEQSCAIANCKVVLTVDTLTSHLAGAMGVPCIQVTSVFPDWRWGTSGESTVWYPKHMIVRQTKAGDWSDVSETVKTKLKEIFT